MQTTASGVSRIICIVSCITLIGCNGVLREKPVEGTADSTLGVVAPSCDVPAPSIGDGHHHPGEDCMMCHYQGGGGPPFTYGGTLYTDVAGTAPVEGATIHMIDANGTDTLVTTAANGNFWSYDLVTYPVVAFASFCPDVKPMVTPLGESDGGCNKGGCHTGGFRVHVP